MWKMALGWPVVIVVAAAACTCFLHMGEPRQEAATSFTGRWRLVDGDGKTSSWLTVKDGAAIRGHAPNLPCRPESRGGELHMFWDDGFHDVLRMEEGRVTFLALGDDGGVRFKLRAEAVE